MQLTKKQEEGLRVAVDRYHAGEKYTVISGYAGSGKSTLVRFIIDALDVSEDDVCYCAFTGKAAEVLRKKGNKNSSTLHKLLYDHIPKRNGGFIRKPKLVINYKIVVVDEVSMAPKEMMKLLFSHRVYVICLGDPFQLPPIDKDADNHLLDKPHVFLDEIMRQAQESEIIRLTMKIRNGETIPYFDGNEIKVIPYKELNTGILQWGDQILTATNTKRQAINKLMKSLVNDDEGPVDGDKIICLRNYWEYFSEDANPLINGTIGYLKNSFQTWQKIPYYLYSSISKFNVLIGDINIIENNSVIDTYHQVNIDEQMILTGQQSLDWKTAYSLGKIAYKIGDIVPKEFAYAYAITFWKAQGSEWDKVVILEEQFPFDRETHLRAMYTAATRASQKLVWVK